MERFVSPLLALFASLRACASERLPRPEWQAHFDEKGARGTFVMFEPAKDRYLVCNPARAGQRFLPASTFEIANALIGLEVGSIADENEVFRWDGKPRVRAAWERDQTLASAMRDGVAWMSQEVARRTGRERMREWIDRLAYGNRDMKGGIDLFWLQGALRVSAVEQVDFLRRLAEGALPMTQRSQRLVREALVAERARGYTLYAKAAASGVPKNAAWWWAGWVERKGRTEAVFAMNLSPASAARPDHLLGIGRAILEESGALPSGFRPS